MYNVVSPLEALYVYYCNNTVELRRLEGLRVKNTVDHAIPLSPATSLSLEKVGKSSRR